MSSRRVEVRFPAQALDDRSDGCDPGRPLGRLRPLFASVAQEPLRPRSDASLATDSQEGSRIAIPTESKRALVEETRCWWSSGSGFWIVLSAWWHRLQRHDVTEFTSSFYSPYDAALALPRSGFL
jgi:hypothetical protein